MAGHLSLVVKRALSLSSVQSALIRPPIPVHGLSGNYALALYSASVKEKVKDNVTKDLNILQEVLKSQKVADYMNDPFIPTAQKLSILQEAATKVKMSNVSLNFFGVLAENNRMNLLEEVAQIFKRINAAENGEVPATVITAQPLDAKQRDAIHKGLSQLLEKGEKLLIAEKVDPTIMGGMIADIGDEYTNMKYIDMSTASKVNKYMNLIKERI